MFRSRRPGGNLPDQQGVRKQTSNRRKTTGYEPKLARPRFSASRADRVFVHEFRLSAAIAPGARTFPHEHNNPNSQNGRHVRRRPRPQQGPRGLHRQGRQHQLHDGVAAPRQQVSTGFEPRPRFRVFPDSRDDRDARSWSARRERARSSPRKRPNRVVSNGRARARAVCASRSTHDSSAVPERKDNAAGFRGPTWQVILYAR